MLFRKNSNPYVEIVIAVFTLLPIPLLVYFYPSLPDRVPEYMDLAGNVVQWGAKTFLSVFRLPLMAFDIQILCLLTKFVIRPGPNDRLVAKLIDWLRIFAAIKLAASSVEPIAYGIERFQFLSTATRATSWVTSAIGVIGVCYYAWQLRNLKRTEHAFASDRTQRARVSLGWVVAFVASLVALPVLMFLPALIQ
jgi:hypothetical protein